MITANVSSTITIRVSSFFFLNPACVAHKEFQEEMKDEISKAFGIPKKYIIPILKRINGRLFTLPEKHVKIET